MGICLFALMIESLESWLRRGGKLRSNSQLFPSTTTFYIWTWPPPDSVISNGP